LGRLANLVASQFGAVMTDQTTAPEPSLPLADPPATLGDLNAEQLPPDVTTSKPVPKKSGAVRETIETLLLALFIFVAVRQVVLNFRVDGHSMDPNLHNGEMLLVNRRSYSEFNPASLINWIPGVDISGHDYEPFGGVSRGDIIVFNPPNGDKPYIKRIIGLPGDVITFQGGSVYVNGVKLEEPYIEEGITNCPTANCRVPVTVGPDQVYVLGDNRGNSEDSRYFGPFDINSIIGKAWVTYWPLSDLGSVPHYDYPDIPEANASGGN
jgi:signal peptidase I